MATFLSRIRRPVKRERAEWYLLVTLLSFAASVLGTRWYLYLTGYPQVGGGALHVAHVLWGGLILFVAALLPLILANREVYLLGGALGGVGVGLFIDEVGKFITRTNDYFYPPAAPIIYAVFLLTVLLYVRLRRPPSRDARAELYRALDAFGEVLDHDLDPRERADLEARLRQVAAQGEQPALARLARALLDFLDSDAVETIPDTLTAWERALARAEGLERRWLGRSAHRAVLALGLVALGLPPVLTLPVTVALAASHPDALEMLVASGRLGGADPAAAGAVRLALSAASGLPLLVAGGLLATGRERRGIALAFVGLLASLTIVDLLLFYFDQFQAVAGALAELVLLLGVLRYRQRYLVG